MLNRNNIEELKEALSSLVEQSERKKQMNSNITEALTLLESIKQRALNYRGKQAGVIEAINTEFS